MKVQDLVGAKVWVEQSGLAECVGYIVNVPKAVNLEDIELSVDASVFTILLESGDVVETSGFNLLEIELAGYIKDQEMAAKEKPPLGEHWKTTDCQLYSRVEFIAEQMKKRQKEGCAPLVEQLRELSDIARELKSLNSRTGTQGVFEALHLLDLILTRSGRTSR